MMASLSLESEIIAGKGISGVQLGLDAKELLTLIKEVDFSEVKVKAYYPRLFEYVYKDGLGLFVDILEGRLVRINLYEKFLGKYLGKVGIGSCVGELREIREDVFFDEDYVIVGQDNELIIRTDYEDEIEDLDDVDEAKISTIIIEMAGWASD